MGGPVPVFIPDVLSLSLRALERQVAARSVRLVRQIDRSTPEVPLDREVFQQVLDTLLSEAVAATAGGGRVRVCLKHSRFAVMLSVKDQGPGMSAEQREGIFTDASREAAPGAPMTLAACRAAVRAMGGNLFANSKPGKGSTYYLTLPPQERPGSADSHEADG